jgi:hypothetical protein
MMLISNIHVYHVFDIEVKQDIQHLRAFDIEDKSDHIEHAEHSTYFQDSKWHFSCAWGSLIFVLIA